MINSHLLHLKKIQNGYHFFISDREKKEIMKQKFWAALKKIKLN
jgi:hypothetical protein